MNIIPSIDLYDGQVVRLRQGSFAHKTGYALDIPQLLREFERSDLARVHIVDLSGAEKGLMQQEKLIRQLCANTTLKIQVGGGIREREQIERLLAAGADRVVIGSLAVDHSERVKEWIMRFGAERIVLAFDVVVQAGVPRVMTQGWQKQSLFCLASLLAGYSDVPLSTVLCTDIQRDGLLAGPNITLYEQLMGNFPTITWLASGGVSSLSDLRELNSIGMQQVIVGKALYEGRLTLAQCQEAQRW